MKLAEMYPSYDPFRKPDYEHYQDEDKSQELVTAITGTTDIVADQTTQVQGMIDERRELEHVVREVQKAMAVNPTPVRRTVEQGAETVCRQVYLQAGIVTEVVAENYDRSQIILSGGTTANVAVSVSEQMTLPLSGFVVLTPPLNSVIIGFTGFAFSRTFKTIRKVWAVSDSNLYLSVQEDFFS